MSYFYTSSTSNIPPQPLPTAVRMTRTGSSSSATSTTSTSSSSSILSSPYYTSTSRPGSSSASFSSSYWSSSPSSYDNNNHSQSQGQRHTRTASNGTSYLPTPFRSSLLHSSASSSPAAAAGMNIPSSYLSDDDLLSLDLQATHISKPPSSREMTTEEQVAAVREQVERERQIQPEAWWQNQPGGNTVVEKRSRVVRFAGDSGRPAVGGRRTSGQGKRRNVAMGGNGKGSGRLD